ncbi:hypothetical protein ZIOFF_060542 [Zingiber officinale]|uniref:Uncharacterized protein n=1 Tax=Zingiber officinale TaxID=94328 RepID=A0A8J5KL98_ZINOF|nr:hypothetical protein ZIOFF_060542 [Zingiber officinale]
MAPESRRMGIPSTVLLQARSIECRRQHIGVISAAHVVGLKACGVISDHDRRSVRINRPIASAVLSPALASGLGSMAIKETMVGAVLACRLHLAVAAALAAAAFSLASAGPSFAAVAGFFWPLLVSTGALLVIVAVLLRISPLPGEASGEGGLADFVAGCPEQSFKLQQLLILGQATTILAIEPQRLWLRYSVGIDLRCR